MIWGGRNTDLRENFIKKIWSRSLPRFSKQCIAMYGWRDTLVGQEMFGTKNYFTEVSHQDWNGSMPIYVRMGTLSKDLHSVGIVGLPTQAFSFKSSHLPGAKYWFLASKELYKCNFTQRRQIEDGISVFFSDWNGERILWHNSHSKPIVLGTTTWPYPPTPKRIVMTLDNCPWSELKNCQSICDFSTFYVDKLWESCVVWNDRLSCSVVSNQSEVTPTKHLPFS